MPDAKKKVLVFVDWYLPGYRAGGPIQSVANMIQHLQRDHQFYVITRDTDEGRQIPYENVQSNTWQWGPQGEQVFYLKENQSPLAKVRLIWRLLQPRFFDVIYINSLFSPWFTLLPLLLLSKRQKEKVMLAPRGMLGKGALALKANKKKWFLRVAKWWGLYNNINWHATSKQEVKEIQRVFGSNVSVEVAANLPTRPPASLPEHHKKTGAVDLVYVSRIHRKKRVKELLQLLKEMAPTSRVLLDLYGPVDGAAYWQKCRQLIEQLPPAVQVNHKGVVPAYEIPEVLVHYDFFVLPTRHENFGHAIFEALSVGCPVIISDRTPWRHLEQHKAGWDLPLEESERFKEVLRWCITMEDEEYQQWRQGAYRYACQFIARNNLREQYRRLFAQPESAD